MEAMAEELCLAYDGAEAVAARDRGEGGKVDQKA